MGSGITQVFAKRDIEVLLYDIMTNIWIRDIQG
jgi:3-hydroxyacyl-CoA dehydrogenase